MAKTNIISPLQMKNFMYVCTHKTVRDRAEVARRAHNPKVIGSTPGPATNEAEKATENFVAF